MSNEKLPRSPPVPLSEGINFLYFLGSYFNAKGAKVSAKFAKIKDY